MKDLNNWAKRFFRADVFHPGDVRHVVAAVGESSFAAKALGLKKLDKVLDVCCGTGRHSLQLAKAGYRVLGVDATRSYIKEAERLGRDEMNVAYAVGDMRYLPFNGEFDAAINLWTSFGYFLRPKEDLKAMKSIARSLRPGGRFLIDIIDADWIVKRGMPRKWGKIPGGGYLLESMLVRGGKDPATLNNWILIKPGKKTSSASFFVRNYNYERMAAIMRKAGLEPIKRWGGLDGRKYKKGDTNRLVVLARKPNA